MTSQKQCMLDACTSGDVAALQRIFAIMDIRKGSKPVYMPTFDGPPATNDLLSAAIKSGNLNIVLVILETYESIQFTGTTINALLLRPDLSVLEALYNYDNGIVNFEFSAAVNTFVTEASKQPPEKIAPLLHFLVEHDADLWTGGLPWQFAVHAALCGDQSLAVIEAMVRKGGPVTSQAAAQAVLRERVDVLEFFIRFGVAGEQEKMQYLRDLAENTGNSELIKLVYMWTRGWTKKTNRATFTRSLLGKGIKLSPLWKRISG